MMSVQNILNPRVGSKFIAEHSLDVKILSDGVKKIAEKLFNYLKTREVVLDVSRWQLHELNPVTQDKAAVDWVFVVDLLNFSFWSDQTNNQPKYSVTYGNHTWTGYWSLCAAFNRALDEGIPITDPNFYRNISQEQLERILRPDCPETCMPLLDYRLESLHTAGQTLCEKFGGSFVGVIEQCNKSATKLLQLIVDNFPTFRDVADYNGQKVGIYKRAQILIGDIWACCGGRGLGEFNDISSITAFADYRIPQSLVWFEVLQYSDELMNALKNEETLENGDRREVEIRGCTIWAIELIVQETNRLIQEDPKAVVDKLSVNSIIVGHFMWDYRREYDDKMKNIPFHKTRCIYY